MNEKKLILMKKGLALFSEKGYHATSIQEIASEAGISKGAFYLYFHSKEDFVATSIEYIHTETVKHFNRIHQENKSAREVLAKQIALMISYVHKYKGFIMMYMSENISIGERLDALLAKMKHNTFKWMKETIEDLYGGDIKTFLPDAIIQLDGLLTGYLKWIVIYDIQIDHLEAGHFIVRRLDNVINGMLHGNEEPMIPKKHLVDMTQYKQQNPGEVLVNIREKLSTLPIEKDKKSELNEVLNTLRQESDKSEVKPILLQGLLAHFAPYPVLHDECEQLAELWGIELL